MTRYTIFEGPSLETLESLITTIKSQQKQEDPNSNIARIEYMREEEIQPELFFSVDCSVK
jgi:hypothetical protein